MRVALNPRQIDVWLLPCDILLTKKSVMSRFSFPANKRGRLTHSSSAFYPLLFYSLLISFHFVFRLNHNMLVMTRRDNNSADRGQTLSSGCDLLVTNSGRFCNQLFEYASLFLLWKKLPNRKPCISKVRSLFHVLVHFHDKGFFFFFHFAFCRTARLSTIG